METRTHTHSDIFPSAIPEGKWEDLTLADPIVFGYVMQRYSLCKRLIELCLQVPIDHIEYNEREKDIHALVEAPGVRLDVYVADGTGRVFNVELQRKDEKYLAQRSRFYQASICYEMAEKARRKAREEHRRLTWDERYGSLHESYVIFICLTDPFDRGWRRYVFQNTCKGDHSLALNDGTCEVFLNASWRLPGYNDGNEEWSAELDAFLSYLKGGYHGDDEYVRALDDEVHLVTSRPEWRKHIMFEYEQWEDLAARIEQESREKGFKIGVERGIEQGIEQGIQQGIEQGIQQGIEQGIQQGIERGVEQGIERGAEQQSDLTARLADALQACGRGDELLAALHDKSLFNDLVSEFNLRG